ncbi:MAG: 50S ribosomal protein L10 [Candidatus Omnitrophota bacterium]
MERIGQIYRKLLKEKVSDNFKNNENLFVIGFDKIVACDVSSLRQSLKDKNASVFVTKNRIVRKALEGKNNNINNIILGSCAFVFTNDDPIKVTKVLTDFQKDHEVFSIKGGLIKDKFLDKEAVISLSKLSSKKDLQAKVVMQLKSPLFRLAGVLNQNISKVILVLKAIKEAKDKGGIK